MFVVRAGRFTCLVLLTTDFGRTSLANFFSTVNPLSGRKPRLGLAADKVTDAGGVQCEIVNARFNYNGTPITVCLGLAEIGDDYGDDVAEAGGFSCFQKIVEVLEQHDVECFVGEGADAVSVLTAHGQHEQISCFASLTVSRCIDQKKWVSSTTFITKTASATRPF